MRPKQTRALGEGAGKRRIRLASVPATVQRQLSWDSTPGSPVPKPGLLSIALGRKRLRSPVWGQQLGKSGLLIWGECECEDLTVGDQGMVRGAFLVIPQLVHCRNHKRGRHGETHVVIWVSVDIPTDITFHLLSASFHKGKGFDHQERQRIASHHEGASSKVELKC